MVQIWTLGLLTFEGCNISRLAAPILDWGVVESPLHRYRLRPPFLSAPANPILDLSRVSTA
jgi:hypothetical protein